MKSASILLLHLLLTFTGMSQDTVTKTQTPCRPLRGILVGYTAQGHFKSGISAELSLIFPNKNCTNCSGIGSLCYLVGSTAGLKVKYFPGSKMFDLSPYYGYKNWNILPLFKVQLDAGYSFAENSVDKNFVHFDPSVSFDLLVFYVSVGYSFRTIRIDNKIGGAFFSVAIAPAAFIKHSKPRLVLTHYRALSKSARKSEFNESTLRE
jgi:hypothetical protein